MYSCISFVTILPFCATLYYHWISEVHRIIFLLPWWQTAVPPPVHQGGSLIACWDEVLPDRLPRLPLLCPSSLCTEWADTGRGSHNKHYSTWVSFDDKHGHIECPTGFLFCSEPLMIPSKKNLLQKKGGNGRKVLKKRKKKKEGWRRKPARTSRLQWKSMRGKGKAAGKQDSEAPLFSFAPEWQNRR